MVDLVWNFIMLYSITDHAAKASFEDGYETMIQIECEVFNTRMFNLKRNVVPEFLLPKTHFYGNDMNDVVSTLE